MKHWEILKKHVETHETQQKVLEHALETLDASCHREAAPPDEGAASRGMDGKSASPVQKYALMMLMDTLDLEKIREYISRVKPTVYALEYYYHKPVSECSLKEIMEGLVVTSRVIGWYDTVDNVDNGDRYTLKITHSLGPNGSKVAAMACDIIFDSCGTAVETVISDKEVVYTIRKK